jgi:hypothetical protein
MGKTLLGDLARSARQGRAATGGPAQQFCGDIDMKIARDGTWFFQGSPIGRKPLVKLFASVLHRDDAGDYWLETPVEKCRIEVADAPFVAIEMIVTGAGNKQLLRFRTNVDDFVNAGPDNPLRVAIDGDTGEPSPYIYVRDGLEALIVRAVFYDLVELGVERRGEDGAERFGVWSGGAFFPLDGGS